MSAGPHALLQSRVTESRNDELHQSWCECRRSGMQRSRRSCIRLPRPVEGRDVHRQQQCWSARSGVQIRA
eukprot:355791-Chlamydomonas_euryale.AAC.10